MPRNITREILGGVVCASMAGSAAGGGQAEVLHWWTSGGEAAAGGATPSLDKFTVDMTADAKLVVDRRLGVLTLPQRAIRRGKDGTWTVDRVVGQGPDATFERTTVELGLSDGLLTEITAGLEDTDRVLLPSGPAQGMRR